MEYAIKVAISALLIVVVSEVAKRSSLLGGFLASLPLVSLLALAWLYLDTKSIEKTAALSHSIFWLVLPSLPFLVVFPWLLRRTENFPVSLIASLGVMLALYAVTLAVLWRFEVQF